MFFFFLLLGGGIIALGIYAVKHPDSWMFRRIGDDREPSEMGLSYTRFAGKVAVMTGVIIIVFGAQALFV